MNSFAKSSSKLFILLSCFFILTLFVDQANLLDIVFGSNNDIDIEHPEEVENCQNLHTAFLNKNDFDKSIVSKKSHLNLPVNVSHVDKRIITDEDSPSTETINADVLILSQPYQLENIDNYSFTKVSKALYLRNSSLLI
ncbi:MAG: hypothetical protein ACYCVH_12915 [Ignavibacteriaceae bacterium]